MSTHLKINIAFIIKKIFHIFKRKEKRQFIGLFGAILITVFLEVAGVASILPFMQLIAEPNAIERSAWLTAAFTFFEFRDHQQMLVYFGIGIIVLITVTNLFSVFTTWLQYKYSWGTAHKLSIRLLATYLHKPYRYFLKTNTNDLRTYIISEVSMLTGGVIIPVIELISRSFVSVVIFILLLLVDHKIALVMFGGLGTAYILIYLSQKNVLKRIGEHRIAMNLLRYQNLQELFDGIKTITVYNQQDFFYKRYNHASKEFCEVQPKYNLILAAPRNVLEILAFGSILSVTIYLYLNSGNIQSALPRLSLYAVAGYRLLPALQKVFSAFAKLRHNYPVLEKLYDDLVLSLQQATISQDTKRALPFDDSLQLENIEFRYDNSEQRILEDLNLSIAKGETVAFIGSTGSGKTTLIDLIVGLLAPNQGQIRIDGRPLTPSRVAAWQKNIAYVPQDVFLFDDTVSRNIVLGIAEEEVDQQRLDNVTQIADIHDFIKEELPEGFNSKIGEKGIRLSGGQRQRLGLARALYTDPTILILDEATSALDSITEKGIIESLKSLPKDLTTIIIAHRLSTVRHADQIYIMEEGRIIARGTYEALVHSNETFKTMVKLS